MPLPSAIVSALAPTGRLRASINLGNPLLAGLDAQGRPKGVSVDLALALAQRLGVEASFVTFDGAAKSVAAVRAEEADIGFFAIDPARSEGLAFTAPYGLIAGAYLVRDSSRLQDHTEVDRAGQRVVVGAGSAYDLFLTRELKSAEIVRVARSDLVVEAFLAQGLDVAAGIRDMLEAEVRQRPGLRMLKGDFMSIRQAMGLPASRGDSAAAFLREFVEDAKRSGLVAQLFAKHDVSGIGVAPMAS